MIGCYFPHVEEFRAEHVGLFWKKYKSDYPKSQQAAPIVDFGDVQSGLELFPMPRFWFTSADDTKLIQIQRNAFLLNWRRKPKQEYPHFESMFATFVGMLDQYRAFISNECGSSITSTTRLELSYINIIAPNQLWKSPKDISQVFPELRTPAVPVLGDGPTGMNYNFRYQLTPDDVLSINIANGKHSQTHDDVFLLEIKMQGTPATKHIDDLESWFDTAHRNTRTAFLSFTNPRMRAEVWKESADR